MWVGDVPTTRQKQPRKGRRKGEIKEGQANSRKGGFNSHSAESTLIEGSTNSVERKELIKSLNG